MRFRSLWRARLPALTVAAGFMAGAGLSAYGQWPAYQAAPMYGQWPGYRAAPMYGQWPGYQGPPAGYYPAQPMMPSWGAPGYSPGRPLMPLSEFPSSCPSPPASAAPQPAPRPPAMPPAEGPTERPAEQPRERPQQPSTAQQPTTEQQPSTAEQQRQEQLQQQLQQQQQQQQAQEPQAGQEQAAATGGEVATVKGDQLGGLGGIVFVPFGTKTAAVAVPAVRSFKIAEDESPVPLDRVYVDFNFFDNVNRSVNERLGSSVHNIEVYRETFGVEKTFLGGDASIGLRLPLNSLTAESDTAGLGGTHTDIGDLAVITKYVFCRDQQTGSLLSGGLAVTTPTGPVHFAGANTFLPIHTWLLTPYAGYRWNLDRWYLQGFLSLDVPTGNDVTILHNDAQIGYWLLRNRAEDAVLTGITPQFEVHVNDPLDHRGAFNLSDPLGTPDWVDLTAAVTFELCHTSTLALGFVTPVTGPKPYDFEVLAQFNWRFGPTRRGAAGAPANVVGD